MLRDLPSIRANGDGYHGSEEVFMNGFQGLTRDDDVNVRTGNEMMDHERAGDEVPYHDPFDDVFGSAPGSPSLDVQNRDHGHEQEQEREQSLLNDSRHHEDRTTSQPRQAAITQPPASAQHPSDLPRLRSTHVTNGYRDGIAVGKEKEMQEGFDEGYWIGAEMGIRGGYVLGVLEGCFGALSSGEKVQRRGKRGEGSGIRGAGTGREGSEDVAAEDRNTRRREIKAEVKELLAQAKQDLDLRTLFAPPWISEDGVWTYDVPASSPTHSVHSVPSAATSTPTKPAHEHDHSHDHAHNHAHDHNALSDREETVPRSPEVTFEQVAAAHPLVIKWTEEVEKIAQRLGLDLSGFGEKGSESDRAFRELEKS